MKLKKAKKEFTKLQSKLEKGKISHSEYENRTNSISATSKDGTNFRVDTSGNWYKYVNNQWIKDNANQEKPPQIETTFQLILYIVKNFFSNIPRMIKKFLIIGVLALIIHTYFVIFPNGGFSPSINNVFLNNLLALKDNEVMSTILWTILSYTITSIFFRIKAMGFKKFFSGLFKGPVRAIKSINKRTITLFSIFTILILLINNFLLKNHILSLTIAIGAFFAIVSHKYSLSYIALKLINSDVAKIRKTHNHEYNDIIFDIIQLSLISGMILYFILAEQTFWIYIAILILFAIAIFDRIINLRKGKTVSFILSLISTLFLVTALRVIADDGGVAEVGGFMNWIGSPGSGQAVLIGLPPAIGSAIGGIIGVITGSSSFTELLESITVENINDSVKQDQFKNELDIIEIQHPEGVIELVFPNGTRQLKFPDGSVKEKWPDGTITGTTSDGTTFIQKTNGELEIVDTNGDIITEYPDGRVVTKRNNGLEVTDNPDGSQVIYDPEYNETIIHNTDGSRTIIEDDGKTTYVDKDNIITKITTKDGYKRIRKDDGTTEVTNINHEGKVIIDKDKSISGTIIRDDGIKLEFSGNTAGIDVIRSDGLTLHVDENRIITSDLGYGNKLISKVGSNKTKIEMGDRSWMTFHHKEGKITGEDKANGFEFEVILDEGENESLEVKDVWGNYSKTYADGSNEIRLKDGTHGYQKSNGEEYLEYPNGSNIKIDSDGTRTYTYANGDIAKVNSDKSIDAKKIDGTILRLIEDQVTIKKPDGSIQSMTLEEYEANIK